MCDERGLDLGRRKTLNFIWEKDWYPEEGSDWDELGKMEQILRSRLQVTGQTNSDRKKKLSVSQSQPQDSIRVETRKKDLGQAPGVLQLDEELYHVLLVIDVGRVRKDSGRGATWADIPFRKAF